MSDKKTSSQDLKGPWKQSTGQAEDHQITIENSEGKVLAAIYTDDARSASELEKKIAAVIGHVPDMLDALCASEMLAYSLDTIIVEAEKNGVLKQVLGVLTKDDVESQLAAWESSTEDLFTALEVDYALPEEDDYEDSPS